MGNPYHRPKFLQSRSWFSIEHDNRTRIVRPVDGEDWFGQPGIKSGVVHLIDENDDLVTIWDLERFEKNASRIR